MVPAHHILDIWVCHFDHWVEIFQPILQQCKELPPMYLLLADVIVLLPESPVLLFSSQYQSPYTFTDCLAPCNTGIKEGVVKALQT